MDKRDTEKVTYPFTAYDGSIFNINKSKKNHQPVFIQVLLEQVTNFLSSFQIHICLGPIQSH